MPVESGEQRLQRLRDRQHVWTQRGFAALVLIGLAVWAWTEGFFEEGLSWSLLWLPALALVYLLFEAVLEAVFAPVGWVLGAIFRPVFRPLSSRGYSYYDDEEREEPAPDYSMAEVIVDDEDPQPLPEDEEEERR
jgi:hypothetical protein